MLLGEIVSFIHGWIFSFVTIVPFIGEFDLVFLNLVFMFGIMIHWYLNNNICALTLLEKIIRGTQDDDQTFFGQIFGKVYSIGKDSHLYWIGISILVTVSIVRLALEKLQN